MATGRAKRYSDTLLERIETYVDRGQRRKARRLLRSYLRSRDARESARVEALSQIGNRREPGHRLYIKPKPSGGYRPIINPDLAFRTRSIMAARALAPWVKTKPHPGGAVRELVAAIQDGYTYLIEVDIRNFFGSVGIEDLKGFLPLPRPWIDNALQVDPQDILLDRTVDDHFHKGGTDETLEQIISYMRDQVYQQLVHSLRRKTENEREPIRRLIASMDDNEVTLLWASLGITQGAPASAEVAELVMTWICERIPGDVRVVRIADDVVICCRCRADVQVVSACLASILDASPAGPLVTKRVNVRLASWGVTFLGYKIRAVRGVVSVTPTAANLAKFQARFDQLRSAPRRKRRAYVHGWCGAFQLWSGTAMLRDGWLDWIEATASAPVASPS